VRPSGGDLDVDAELRARIVAGASSYFGGRRPGIGQTIVKCALVKVGTSHRDR
jgi:hypothetical protein